MTRVHVFVRICLQIQPFDLALIYKPLITTVYCSLPRKVTTNKPIQRSVSLQLCPLVDWGASSAFFIIQVTVPTASLLHISSIPFSLYPYSPSLFSCFPPISCVWYYPFLSVGIFSIMSRIVCLLCWFHSASFFCRLLLSSILLSQDDMSLSKLSPNRVYIHHYSSPQLS